MLDRDIRGTPLYREAEELYRKLRGAGTGQISDAAEISTFGNQAVFTGTLVGALDGESTTQICLADLNSGEIQVLTFGPNFDRSPKFDPSGRQIAFLSDRHRRGDFQLYLVDPASGAVRVAPNLRGWVEYLHWSPDGAAILLGVAGHGADVAGAQGAIASKQIVDNMPAWMPTVQAGDQCYHWRSVWIYDLGTDTVREVSTPTLNVWEAVWCGNKALAAIASPRPSEALWYSARLYLVDAISGRAREVYKPQHQIGAPAASPSGQHLAIVEAVCSDRCLVAGDLRVIDLASGQVCRIDTLDLDIAYTEWRSNLRLLLAGHRGPQTVVCTYDALACEVAEVWASQDVSVGGLYATVSGLDEAGDCALVGEGFTRAPEIAILRHGDYIALKSFKCADSQTPLAMPAAQHLSWRAADGVQIQGWLLQPNTKAPHPLIMNVHGGPVWHWRPRWLGRDALEIMMLLKRGYAIFYPNPRGSAGRGKDFAQQVVGDLGGADAGDCLCGLDYLVEKGIANPRRMGVLGVSYGGYMASWLITQDRRFAAAVSIAPMTNFVTTHLISNISHFVSAFLDDTYSKPGSKYFTRSPVTYAHKAITPTLNICGALDRCTPPEEAIQFHNALLENGVKSVLVTYPEEGHGVHKLPAVLDCSARIVSWFQEHMPP